MNKKIFIPILAASIIGVGSLTATHVLAEDSTNQNPMSSLVQKIADKFGLNKDEVQAVFDADRQERQAEMETQFEDQLTQAVSEGSLTEDQKQLILAKRQEIESNRQSQMESTKDMTADERKTAMASERQALEDWASQNGIDMKYLMGGGPDGRGGPGPGGPGGQPPDDGGTPPQAPANQ